MVGLDEIGAGFGVLPGLKSVANGPDAPANSAAGLDDRDLGAGGLEIASRRQAGQSRAGDDDRSALE